MKQLNDIARELEALYVDGDRLNKKKENKAFTSEQGKKAHRVPTTNEALYGNWSAT